MSLFSVFTSRNEKTILLTEIIQKLNISTEEKELYILSLSLLDEKDFIEFYSTIHKQISTHTSTIAPFSLQLI